MSRRRPFSRRALTAGIGLLTVWCLGCSSLDLLAETWFQGDAECMAFDRNDEGAGGSTVSESARPGSQASVSEQDAHDCGCASCHAPPAPLSVVASVPPVGPFVAAAGVRLPPSVRPDPLIPPPEVIA
jgi:hypothetical protein